eukprot:gene16100-24664_t
MKVALTVIKEYVRRVIEERKKEAREYDASDLIAILEKQFAVCVPGDFVPKIKFTIVLMTENGMPAVVTPRAS